MNKPVLILVIILAALIGLTLLLSLFGPKKGPTPIKPVIQASFSPTPYNPLKSSPATIDSLRLISISPTESTNQSYFPIKQVFFTFNKPMNPATVNVESSPFVKIVTSLKADDPNTIVISPQEKWQEGITTIAIKNTTTSSDGSKLDLAIVYKLNTQFPKNPPPDSPGL